MLSFLQLKRLNRDIYLGYEVVKQSTAKVFWTFRDFVGFPASMMYDFTKILY